MTCTEAPDWAAYLAFRDDFAELLDPRFYTLDWLDGEVLSGRVQALRSDNAGILFTVKDYPAGGRELHGMAAAGDMGEIVNLLIPLAEAWGRDRGCCIAVIESRAGWQRALEPHGYELHQVALRKGL